MSNKNTHLHKSVLFIAFLRFGLPHKARLLYLLNASEKQSALRLSGALSALLITMTEVTDLVIANLQKILFVDEICMQLHLLQIKYKFCYQLHRL